MKLGRNDPCPCGSGKKYKRCHWDADMEQPGTQSAAVPEAETAAKPMDFESLRQRLRTLAGKFPDDGGGEFTQTLGLLESLADYQARLPEIEAAGAKLEAYRAEFEALLRNETEAMECAHRLFAEERFARCRLRASDVQRAFATVGYPGTLAGQRLLEVLRKTILFLGDKDRRQAFSLQLALALPDYVADGRYLDGWLIQQSAVLMQEEPDEPNPFLYEMFQHGLMEWEAERHRQDATMLATMGLDPEKLRGRTAEEVEQVLNEIYADPAKQKEIEAHLESHPELRGALEADCINANDLMVELLDSDDAAALLPNDEETLPWLLEFQQRVLANPQLAKMLDGGPPPANANHVLGEIMKSVSHDMAAAVFTPARVAQLKVQLCELVDRHRAAGNDIARTRAQAAHLVLLREGDAADNQLLFSICWTALRDGLRNGAQAGDSPLAAGK